MQAGAGGHDIIQNGNMLSAQIGGTGKSATYSFCPFLPWQAYLRRCGADAFCALGEKRKVELPGHDLRQFQRLVEASFTQAGGMQRHRDQHIGTGSGPDSFN